MITWSTWKLYNNYIYVNRLYPWFYFLTWLKLWSRDNPLLSISPTLISTLTPSSGLTANLGLRLSPANYLEVKSANLRLKLIPDRSGINFNRVLQNSLLLFWISINERNVMNKNIRQAIKQCQGGIFLFRLILSVLSNDFILACV